MLTKAQIRGILKFKSLDVDFDRVTTIVGSTDKGKSTFIWALYWLMTNPTVTLEEFVHNKSKLAQMRLFLDGHSVMRKKGESKNIYILDKGKPYKAFKKEKVPDKIKKLFNVDDINFQFQHDNPFWFCKTPGMASRELNKLINLEVMDNTLSNLDTWLRKERDKKAEVEKDIQDFTEQLELGQFVHEFDVKLSTLETLEKRFQRTALKCRRIKETINKAISYQKLSVRACTGREIARLAVLSGQMWLDLRESRQELENLIKKSEGLRRIINNKPPDISDIEKDFVTYDRLRNKRTELERLIKLHREYLWKITKHRQRAERIEKQLRKAIGKKCPLCGKRQNEKNTCQ